MPAQGNILRVTMSGIADGQTIENVIHMREVAENELDSAINLSLEALRVVLMAYHPASFQFLQTRFKRITPVPLDEQFVPLTGQSVGSGSGGLVNTTIALVHTLRTGVAGKTHRGRMYTGALASDLTISNRLSTGGQTIANNISAAILNLFGTNGTDPTLRLGIYSRVIGGTNPFTVAGWQQVQQIVPQNVLGNQRRRRVGVGI